MNSTKIILFLCIVFIVSAGFVHAESDYMKKFKSDYDILDQDLLRHSVEEMQVTDFTYTKDIATFHFENGMMYFLRYVDDRPTTAIFIGTGSAKINIPSEAEQNSLESISGKPNVDEEFTICFIRMGDDFDLKVKEKFPSETKELKWKDFTQAKEAQGEYFFKPIISHLYDNYFQLLHSVYERNEDGFFWIDFNRYNFMYDPNRPLPVIVGYEFEINDTEITNAVFLNKNSPADISNTDLSNVTYPTTAISHTADLNLSGLDGSRLDQGHDNMKVVINADSIKFINTFLHFHLKLDSLLLDGKPIDYYRRKDFRFIGIILPRYYHKGDTLDLTYWYEGKDFDYILPYVEDPTPSEHSFTFTVPEGYNYLMPGMGTVSKADGGMETFTAEPQNPYKEYYFQGYATNFDTLTKTSKLGVPINFLKSKAITKQSDCFIPDNIYETSVMNAFNFMASKVGAPIGAFGLYVFPKGFTSMPGLVEVPQIICYDRGYFEAFGGFNLLAGYSMAKQWFGHLVKPRSENEYWLESAASEYLLLEYLQNVSSSAYYSNLSLRSDSLSIIEGLHRNRPLYLGDRAGDMIETNKGVWFFHMLRYLMTDLKTGDDGTFQKFFHRLCLLVNSKEFTNKDIIDLAEKYYGSDLSWFFDEWLFDYRIPSFDVQYDITGSGNEYYVYVDVTTDKVKENFKMPVVLNVKDKKGNSTLLREMVTGTNCSFKLGPYSNEPDELVFNELYSTLGDVTTKKRK